MLTVEREKDIRNKIAFALASGAISYCDSRDAQDLLAEIDRLREKLALTENALAFYCEEGGDDAGKTGHEALAKIRCENADS